MKKLPISKNDELVNDIEKSGIKMFRFNQHKKINAPIVKENVSKDWVQYGENNSFFDKLIYLADNATLHNAIMTSNIQEMLGKGIIFDDESKAEETQIYLDTIKYRDLFEKMFTDLEYFNGISLEIIKGKNKTYIAEVNSFPFEKICPHKKVDGEIPSYYYSTDWSKTSIVPEEIPVYGNNESREIYYFKKNRKGTDYFPKPSYIAALNDIQMEDELSNFQLSNILNGFNPGCVIWFEEDMTLTEDQKNKLEKDLKRKFQGGDNNGNMILMISGKAPTIKQLETSGLAKMFDTTETSTARKIMSAHGITNPELVAIKTPGELGSSTDLIQSYNLYFKKVITPAQRIIENIINTFLKNNGLSTIKIENEKLIETSISENMITKYLTDDEVRETYFHLKPRTTPIEPVTQTSNIFKKLKNKLDAKELGTFYQVFKTTQMIDISDILKQLNDLFPDKNITESDIKVQVDEIDYNTSLSLISEKNMDDLYVWELNNSENPCPSCLGFEGSIHTLREWYNIAIPGHQTYEMSNGVSTSFPHAPYGTFCEDSCRCKLIKI